MGRRRRHKKMAAQPSPLTCCGSGVWRGSWTASCSRGRGGASSTSCCARGGSSTLLTTESATAATYNGICLISSIYNRQTIYTKFKIFRKVLRKQSPEVKTTSSVIFNKKFCFVNLNDLSITVPWPQTRQQHRSQVFLAPEQTPAAERNIMQLGGVPYK